MAKGNNSHLLRLRLDAAKGQYVPELYVLGGPLPYVWIGYDNHAWAFTRTMKDVRRLRDALTQALRQAR